jgi:hypothetical protein
MGLTGPPRNRRPGSVGTADLPQSEEAQQGQHHDNHKDDPENGHTHLPRLHQLPTLAGGYASPWRVQPRLFERALPVCGLRRVLVARRVAPRDLVELRARAFDPVPEALELSARLSALSA